MSRKILLLALVMLFSASPASASFVYSINSDTFLQGTGIQELTVFARTTDQAETVQSSVLDFSVDNGGVFAIPAGTFGQAGQIGAGNLAASSFTGGGTNLSNLTLDFNSAEVFPLTDQAIATLRFDTSALAPGSYNVNIFEASTGGPQGPFPTFEYTSTATGGNFTITAVPEPTSFALVGLAGAGMCAWRRRARSKSAKLALVG